MNNTIPSLFTEWVSGMKILLSVAVISLCMHIVIFGPIFIFLFLFSMYPELLKIMCALFFIVAGPISVGNVLGDNDT